MPSRPQNIQKIPVEVVGSSTFGIFPKISLSKTYNMFISDEWMINYAGYRILNSNIEGSQGRGLFNSIRGDFCLVVIDDKVYKLNNAFGASLVGNLNTRFGDVIMDENLSSQICIVDGNDAWIYNYDDETFTLQTLDVGFDVVPGYVTYHNSFFLIAPSINDPNNTFTWYAFQYATASTIEHVALSSFPIQTKPDNCLAVKRLPGKANNVLVIGSTVCEVYTQLGGEENYRRNSSFNIDSGCVSLSTIAEDDQFLCFLAQNENSAPRIIFTDGAGINHISTDGIDNLLETINHPQDSTAFFYRQDGHLFYQLTFFNPADNLTLTYDFNTQKFFHVTDPRMNYHPARKIVYFNKKIVFVSLKRGALYEMSTEIDGAYEIVGSDAGEQIPRVRVTNTMRIPDGSPFFSKQFTFIMEQGVTDFSDIDRDSPICELYMETEYFSQPMITEVDDEYMLAEDGFCSIALTNPRVDLSFSKNGNQSFSNIVGYDLNTQGHYANRIRWFRLGYANEITFQLRFWGFNRFIVSNGMLEAAA